MHACYMGLFLKLVCSSEEPKFLSSSDLSAAAAAAAAVAPAAIAVFRSELLRIDARLIPTSMLRSLM